MSLATAAIRHSRYNAIAIRHETQPHRGHTGNTSRPPHAARTGTRHGWSRGEGSWRYSPLVGDSFLQVDFPVLTRSLGSEEYADVPRRYAPDTTIRSRNRQQVPELTIYGARVASAFDEIVELLLQVSCACVVVCMIMYYSMKLATDLAL